MTKQCSCAAHGASECVCGAWDDTLRPPPCKWTYDKENGCYDTECKGSFWIEKSNLKVREFNFCPKCGGEIKEETHDPKR